VTPEAQLTHSEFTTSVGHELERLAMAQSNGQVSAVPDARTLRYYATRGLLDPPIEVRGRKAIYGHRHVLQAVAVKALQAQGLALTEIQQRLTGQSDTELEAVIRRQQGARFWHQVPTSHSPTEPTTERPAKATPEDGPPAQPAVASQAIGVDPVAVRLSPGVTLVVDPVRPPTADDLEAIHHHASALRQELQRRGLIEPEQETP